MSVIRNEHRIRKLEHLRLTVDGHCNCREGDQETLYHGAADLERIIAVRCPLHGIRRLGRVSWVPSGMPLRAEDRDLCVCPACAAREWLEGRRGPLTEDEQEAECLNWAQQLTEEADAKI